MDETILKLNEVPIEQIIRRIHALDWVTPRIERLWDAERDGNRLAREIRIAYNKCYYTYDEVALIRLERAIARWQEA